MAQLLIYLTYLSHLMIGIICAWTVGRIILPKTNGSFFYSIFTRCFWGLIVLSSLWALICTKGLTIQVMFLPIVAYWIWDNRHADVASSQSDKHISLIQGLAILSIGILAIYSWVFGGRIHGGAFPFALAPISQLSPNDILQYSFISFFNGLTGQENYAHIYNTLDPIYHGPKPYHYLEGWWSNLICQALGGLSSLDMSLVSISTMYIIAFLGILALWEHYGFLKWYGLLIGLAMLFVAGIYFPQYESVGVGIWSLPILSYRYKIGVYYIFLLGFILETLRNKKLPGILYVLALPVATMVAYPAVLGVYLGLLVSSPVFHFFSKQQLRLFLLLGASILGGIAGFYLLFMQQQTTSSLELTQDQISIFHGFGLNWIINKIQRMWELPLWNLLVLYLPYLLIWLLALVLQKKKKPKVDVAWLFIVSTLLLGSASLAFSLLEGEKEAFQLAFNIGIPFCNVLVFTLLPWMFRRIHSMKRDVSRYLLGASVALIFGVSLVQQFPKVLKKHIKSGQEINFSEAYLLKIQRFIQSGKASKAGVYIKGYEDYQSDYARRPVSYTLGYYLAYMANGYVAVSISDFGIPIKKEKATSQKKDISSGVFYQFVQKKRKSGNKQVIAQHQIDFIDTYQINFLIVSPNARMSELLRKRVAQSFHDPVSGESFHILNVKRAALE